MSLKLGFPSILFIVFLVLKLQHTIAWSWWWVTAPLWVPSGIAFAIMVFALVMAGIAALIGSRR